MQVTLTIPDDIAAQAQARGLSVEAYVQDLFEKALSDGQQPPHARTREEIKAFFRAMAEGSERLPKLPTAHFTRESFYEDCH